MSHLMYSPQYLQAMAEQESKATREKAEQKEKRRLLAHVEFVKQLDESDIIKSIQKFSKEHYDNAQERLIDLSKRKPNETSDALAVQIAVHKMYLDLFDAWNREGQSAMKKLMEENQ